MPNTDGATCNPSQLEESLYREHLEEASFLFEQRQQWLEDPQLGLADVVRLEGRLEAHVDGLVVGAARAWPRCRAAVMRGDTGELHAAVRVGCRHDLSELLGLVAGRLGADDHELHVAVAHAFVVELHESSAPVLERGLYEPVLQAVLARAIGYQRLDLGAALLRAANARPEPWTLWALGELRHHPARDRLRELSAGEPSPLRRAATIAALKLGVRDAAARSEDPLILALTCDDGDLGSVVDQDLAEALALRGDARALAMLTELLGETELAGIAAGGLLLATGTPLLEPHPEPDFAALIGEADDPSSPSRLRPSRDASLWRSHLREVGSQAGRRRMGAAVSLVTDAGAIATLAVPLALRNWLCEELAIRHGVDMAIRPDMLARTQLSRLEPLRRTSA